MLKNLKSQRRINNHGRRRDVTMSKSKFALGALIGAAAGVVAGVLTAPKSGKETRADLKAKAEKAKVDASKKADVVTAKANDMAKDAKEKAQGVANKFADEAVSLKSRTESAVEGAKKGFFEKDKK